MTTDISTGGVVVREAPFSADTRSTYRARFPPAGSADGYRRRVLQLCVVIPARNEEARIGEQLEALITQECDVDWGVVVVDNGSTDRTAEVVKRYGERSSRVRLVSAPERGDQSFAANRGVAASEADAVAFCDADDVVAPGWVQAMADGLRRHDVVTGPNELDRLNPCHLASSRGRSIEQPVGTFAGIFPCVRGNNYGVRAEVWDRIGPLNEGYFPVADIEFSMRCWRNGIQIVGLPDAVVHYRYRSSVRDLWRQGWKYGAGRPRIARELRDAGERRPPRFSGWKSWIVVVFTAPRVVTAHGRAQWVWVAANRLGQLAGSVKWRVLML
jgi:glycosyltransferase involved in cell wall biosynthesis